METTESQVARGGLPRPLAVRETFLSRSRAWLRSLMASRYRDTTDLEARQAAEIESLQTQLRDLEYRCRASERSCEQLQSQVKIAQIEAECLMAVVVRNQKRVEAETASAAREIAMATMGRTT